MLWLQNVFDLFLLLFRNVSSLFSNIIGLFIAAGVVSGLIKLTIIILKSDWGNVNE